MEQERPSQQALSMWDPAQRDQSCSLKPAPESRPCGWHCPRWLQGGHPLTPPALLHLPSTSKPPKENPEPGLDSKSRPRPTQNTRPRPRPTQDARPRLLRVPLCTGAEAPACGSCGPAGGVSWGPDFGVTATPVSSLGRRGLLVGEPA